MIYTALEFCTLLQKIPVFATEYRQFRNFQRYRYEKRDKALNINGVIHELRGEFRYVFGSLMRKV
jgi:hypothetical protein